MEKKLKVISIMVTSAMILSLSAPMTVLAETDDSVPPITLGSALEKRGITAYRYSMDDSFTVECLFTAELPDMPYINVVDYCETVFIDSFTEAKNEDGTYTVANSKGTMVIDPDADTVYFESFEDFSNAKSALEGTDMASLYVRQKDNDIEGEKKSLTLDYGKYGIDLIEDDDKVYFPLTTISNLFVNTYNGGEYLDGSIYFIHSLDEAMKGSYIDKSSVFEKTVRTPEMIEYTYNNLCFNVDYFYGRPSKAAIASLIDEKGFDKALDELNDGTRHIKEIIKSESLVGFIVAMAALNNSFEDGGHTIHYFPFAELSKYPDSACMAELTEYLNNDPLISIGIQFALMNPNSREMERNNIKDLRKEKYSAFELVKSWEGDSGISFIRNGDTGVFVRQI